MLTAYDRVELRFYTDTSTLYRLWKGWPKMKTKTTETEFLTGDCMELLSEMDDNYYTFVIVDPPYGFNPATELYDECMRIARKALIWIDPIVWQREVWSRKGANLPTAQFVYPVEVQADGVSGLMHCRVFSGNEDWYWPEEIGLHDISTERHPGAKPLSAMLEILSGCKIGDFATLLDPMCGSGSSIEAARQLGFDRAVGIDLAERVQGA